MMLTRGELMGFMWDDLGRLLINAGGMWMPAVYGGNDGPESGSDSGADGAGDPAGDNGGGVATASDSPPVLSPLDFKSSLRPDLQANPTVQQYKTMNDAMDALVETKRMVGGSIRLPSESDSPEVRAEKLGDVYAKLGRPGTAGEYAIPEGLEYPEGFQPFTDDSIIMQSFRQGAFEHGLSQEAFNWVMEVNAQQWREVVNQAAADKAASGVTGMNELKGMHGAATPQVMQRAQHIIEMLGSGAFGGPDIGAGAWAEIEAAGLHQSPKFVTALANLANRMMEGPYHQTDDTFGTMSSADIDREIGSLREKERTSGLTPQEDARMNQLYTAKRSLMDADRRPARA